MLLWADAAGGSERRDAAAEVFREVLADVPLDCAQCQAKLEFAQERIRIFWERGEIQCNRCGTVLQVVEPFHSVREDG